MTPREDNRKVRTRQLLLRIQNSEDKAEKQSLAWQVVTLNEAAATWLAKRFCPHPNEDDVSEARLSLFDAALYCHPEKGSSYLSVAAWYYMRRTTGTRNGAGIHIPANIAQAASRVRSFLGSGSADNPLTLRDAIRELNLNLTEVDLHVVLWAVGNPNSNNVSSIGAPAVARDSSAYHDEAPYELPAPDVDGEAKKDIELLRKKLRNLNQFQLEAVRSYTLEGPALKTIGANHGVSREWVNQTRKRVLRDLRAAMRVPD